MRLRIGLRGRTLAAALLVLLCAMSLFAVVAVLTVSSGLKAEELAHARADAQLLAANLDQRLGDDLRALDAIAAQIDPARLQDTAYVSSFLRQHATTWPMFSARGLALVGRDGRLLGITRAGAARGSADPADRAELRSVLRDGQAHVTTLGTRGGAAPLLAFVAPVRGADGRTVAALLGRSDLADPTFLRAFLRDRGDHTRRSVVSLAQGVYLASSDPALRMRVLPPAGQSAFADLLRGGFSGVTTSTDRHGVQSVYAVAHLRRADWAVVQSVPTRILLAPVAALRRQLLAGGALILLVALAAATWLVRAPLRVLHDAAMRLDAMAHDDAAPVELPERGDDEIRRVVAAFNRMGARLRAKRDEIERGKARLQASYEEVSARETRYRAVLETATDGFLDLDRRGHVSDVNAAYLERSGRTRDQLIGMPLAALDAQESAPAIDARLQRLHAQQRDAFITRHRTADGGSWPVEVHAAYWPDADGHVFVFARDITERLELERMIIDAGALEQARTGRVLHDGIGQQLTAVSLFASSLHKERLQADDPATAQRLAEMRGHLNVVLREVRALARGLSPLEIGPDGLNDALAQLVQLLRESTDATCGLCIDGDVRRLAPVSAVHLYRIAQEAANNAVLHARAQRIDVGLHYGEQALTLRVADDGIGLAADAPHGLGLSIMRYRARSLGAQLSFSDQPHGGLLVVCRTPLAAVIAA